MKVLHTSDWHLGHVLYGYDRMEEQISMLRQITEIATRERPDLFLLCGDVFHVSQPSAAINKIFVNSLSELCRLLPEMKIVVISGNHDSGTRHEVFSSLWEEFGVHTVGTLHLERLEDHIIEIPGKGFVVALPYVHQRLLPEGLIQELLDMTAERNKNNLPVFMTGHTTIARSLHRGHEDATEFSVGGIDGIEIEELGEGYDYLALGHIHQRQFIDGEQKKVRYSGSPMAVNFDEEDPHTVTIVEIDRHGDKLEVKEEIIENPRPLVTLPTEGEISWERARKLLEEYPAELSTYLRLKVSVEDFLPVGATEEAFQLTKDKACRFCVINAIKKRVSGERKESFNVQEFRQQPPLEIFRRYAEETGINFDDELENMFRETLREIEEEKI